MHLERDIEKLKTFKRNLEILEPRNFSPKLSGTGNFTFVEQIDIQILIRAVFPMNFPGKSLDKKRVKNEFIVFRKSS